MQTVAISSLPKKNSGSERTQNPKKSITVRGLHRVSIKGHQLQGKRDPSTVFTLPYFAECAHVSKNNGSHHRLVKSGSIKVVFVAIIHIPKI